MCPHAANEQTNETTQERHTMDTTQIVKFDLIVTAKTVYGKTSYYPENKHAVVLCNLLNQNTLTKQNLVDLKEIANVIIESPKIEQI